jgi:hypothetical protein
MTCVRLHPFKTFHFERCETQEGFAYGGCALTGGPLQSNSPSDSTSIFRSEPSKKSGDLGLFVIDRPPERGMPLIVASVNLSAFFYK